MDQTSSEKAGIPFGFLFLLFWLTCTGALSFKASTQQNFLVMAMQCFEDRTVISCRKALIGSEALKREAGALELYSCQTRLLGLEADMILSMEKKVSRRSALKTLEEVKTHCSIELN